MSQRHARFMLILTGNKLYNFNFHPNPIWHQHFFPIETDFNMKQIAVLDMIFFGSVIIAECGPKMCVKIIYS